MSEDPLAREKQHNSGLVKSWTKRHKPWSLVHSELHPGYRAARKRELELKAQKSGKGFFLKTGLDPKRFGR
jgi:predicted GIY-YIG superfamily endonuclease